MERSTANTKKISPVRHFVLSSYVSHSRQSIARIVPLFKETSNKGECINSRGIRLLSVVGIIFVRVLIKRVGAGGGMHKSSYGRLSKRRSNSPRRVLGLAVSV